MKPPGGRFLRLCTVAVLIAMPWMAARAQDQTSEPITRVEPVTSPSPADENPLSPIGEEPMTTPAKTPAAAPVETPAATSVETPASTPAQASTPAPVATPAPIPAAPAPPPAPSARRFPQTNPDITTPPPLPTPVSPYSIEIDLGKQRAYLLEDGAILSDAPISSGRAGHLTPTGNFSVLEKDLNHVSSLYGEFIDKESGRVVKAGADSAMPVPKGCVFVPAPMKWFMRFDGAAGMHAGILPGYPASHGCVRMPAAKAEFFYQTVDVGTPVHVFGDTPVREIEEDQPRHLKPSPTPKARHGWWIF